MPVISDRQVKFSGAKLRAARIAAGWSREELSVAGGRSAGTIAHYENGRYNIPLMVARTFAALLGVPLESLAETPRNRSRGRNS